MKLRLSKDYDKVVRSVDLIARLANGEVGPEVGKFMANNGPKSLRKKVKNGRLKLNVNIKKPYIGFTYRLN